jgi:hypothetical protein
MKKLFAVLIAVGAILFIRKHYYGASEPAPPTKAEQTAEAIGRIAKKEIDSGRDPKKAVSSYLSGLMHGGAPQEAAPEQKAKERVEAFMGYWQKGGVSLNDAEQAAACMWARGVVFIVDKDDFQDAVNGFDRWRRDRDLYHALNEYAIGPPQRRTDAARGDYTAFDIVIDGTKYVVGVPDGTNPMFWPETPSS